jgi:hypothetical protein
MSTAGLRIEAVSGGLAVRRERDGVLLVGQNAKPGDRPHVHPLIAPDGVGEATENRPPHHPWQRGLYVGLNDVNGEDFWVEGLIPGWPSRSGSFDVLSCEVLPTDHTAAWRVRTAYLDGDGDRLLVETQTWTLVDREVDYFLDLDWQLEAVVPVVFGAYEYGGPFLRMPYREGTPAEVLTSEGATTPADADQQRARWVALGMPLPGREGLPEPRVTVTIMDHPDNPEHPVPWRVDEDFGVAPSRCIAGEWRLEAGESTRAVHRFLVALGSPDAEAAESAYRNLTEEMTR